MNPPVVSGGPVLSRVLLVGQAPGDKEPKLGRPFAWTAGKTLFGWFEKTTGLTEAQFRASVYMAAVCRCFPGKKPTGGDRVPSPEEVANCAVWLREEFEILRPELVLPVGRLAIEQFLPPQKLDAIIGRQFELERAGHRFVCIPLPHPSGASPWHRVEPGKTLLRRALRLIAAHPAFKAILYLLMLVLAAGMPALAQDEMPSLDDLLQAGAQWAKENIDDDVLRSLGEVDQQKAKEFFRVIEQRLQGDYVVDLAALQQTAATVLPLLEQHPETRPYAAWLKTRMDYFEVAEQFRASQPPPKIEPGRPYQPAPNPEPSRQRLVWQKQLEKCPLAKEAESLPARLKPVFVAQKVPAELVWLAAVESSFDPAARSPVGAVGLFQLMPQTASSLGLSLRPTDERLNPERNAAAAAKYLRTLHSQFKDWRLALAAYNAGAGKVHGLLTRYRAKTFDQVAVHLPAETQMYVPKVEATILRRTGAVLSKLPAPGT
jgi:uracil-DNA glycosylase family 4